MNSKKPPYKKKADHKSALKAKVISESKKYSETALSTTDPLTQYMAEIKKYEMLSREEERKTALLFQETGNPEYAQKLVTANLRFVVKVAMEYAKFGAKLIDLIQEGNLGLMRAVKEYNPYKDVRLITYAVWWIRGYIQEYLMKQYSLVKIGTTQNQKKLFYRLQKEREEFERLGFQSAVKMLSGKLDISEKEIIEMSQRVSGKDLSLSQPFGDSDSKTLLDLQSSSYEVLPDVLLEKNEAVTNLQQHIEELRPSLSERELFLLDKRILAEEPKTLQEIGDLNGVSREAVRQMEARLMKKIKSKLNES